MMVWRLAPLDRLQ